MGTSAFADMSWQGMSRQLTWDGTRIVGGANIIRQAVNLDSSGWSTTAQYSPTGDIIAATAWGGPGNAPLQLFTAGAGTAKPLGKWFYQPAF